MKKYPLTWFHIMSGNNNFEEKWNLLPSKNYLGEEKNIHFTLSISWLHDFNGLWILI